MFFVLLALALVLLVVYCKIKYFTIRGSIAGLSPHLFFGNLIQAGLIFDNIPLPKALSTFQKRFGDIFQFWFGPSRVIVVAEINDVKHVFTNRQIYDQGEMFIDILSSLFPNGLICLKG